MTAWLDSSEHRANILEPDYTDVGFAVMSGTLQGKPTVIVVALYGRPAVASVAQTNAVVAGAHSKPLSLVARLGVAAQSMTPAALGSIMLFGFMAAIAFAAHLYRNRLPRAFSQSWYRHHHGAIKVGGMLSLMLIMLVLYSGGQV